MGGGGQLPTDWFPLATTRRLAEDAPAFFLPCLAADPNSMAAEEGEGEGEEAVAGEER